MSVMFVFHLPNGAGMPYLTGKELEFNLPVARSTYIFHRRRYEVIAVHEDLDRNADGTRLSASSQLFSLMAALAADGADAVAARLAQLRNFGEPAGKASKGGVFEPASFMNDLFKDVNRVIMVEMKLLGAVNATDIDSALRGKSVKPAS